MSKHTPGPWYMSEEYGLHVYSPAEKMQIADILLCDASDPEPYATADEKTAKANARLIAAAPDLLAALRDMVRFVGTDAGRVLSMIPEDTWYAAHHAIAKATD